MSWDGLLLLKGPCQNHYLDPTVLVGASPRPKASMTLALNHRQVQIYTPYSHHHLPLGKKICTQSQVLAYGRWKKLELTKNLYA